MADSVPSTQSADVAASMAQHFAPVLAILNHPDPSALSKSEKITALKNCLKLANYCLEMYSHDEQLQRLYLPLKSVCEELLAKNAENPASSAGAQPPGGAPIMAAPLENPKQN